MKFFVTHFFSRPAESAGWVFVPFIARHLERDGDVFTIGLEDFGIISEEEIIQRAENNEIKPVEHEWPITEDQAVWLSPCYDVWIASKDDPIGDREKVRISKGQIQYAASALEGSVKERITSRRYSPDGAGTGLFLDDGYVVGESYSDFLEAFMDRIEKSQGIVWSRTSERLVRRALIDRTMIDGLLDFYCQPYFLAPNRELLDVLPFGQVETFSCVVSERSSMYQYLCSMTDEEAFERRLDTLIAEVPGLEIAVVRETAATSEVTSRFRREHGLLDHFRSDMETAEQLSAWLIDDSSRKMVVCDHGVARDLCNHMEEEKGKRKGGGHRRAYRSSGPFAANTETLTFRYSSPLVTGFAFPRGDERWKRTLAGALALTLISSRHTPPVFSWDPCPSESSVTTDLAGLGIKAMSFDALCGALHVDVQRVREMNKLIESEDYLSAKTLADKLMRAIPG